MVILVGKKPAGFSMSVVGDDRMETRVVYRYVENDGDDDDDDDDDGKKVAPAA